METTFVNLLDTNQRKLYDRRIITLHEAMFATIKQPGCPNGTILMLLNLWTLT